MNGSAWPGGNGSAMAPQSKKSYPKPGEFLALKWHRLAWSWHGAKPKNRYKSTSYNATELKRRAANYSESLLGLATAKALSGSTVWRQRDWHWLGVVHRGLAVPLLDD